LGHSFQLLQALDGHAEELSLLEPGALDKGVKRRARLGINAD